MQKLSLLARVFRGTQIVKIKGLHKMKKVIVVLTLIASFILFLCSFSLFEYDEDIYSDKKREEIITKKILKCKDVINVKVNEHGMEQSRADIEVTLTNGRSLILSSYGIHLRLENLWIRRIGDIVPVEFEYRISKYKGNSRMISLGIINFNASYFKYLDQKLNCIKDITTLINNYDLIYSEFSKLPSADETFPCIAYWDSSYDKEIYCEAWEQMKNPYFYKTEKAGGKFYKMTIHDYNNYNISCGIKSRVLE